VSALGLSWRWNYHKLCEFKHALDSPIPVQRMENVATYSEARSEYTKQLATFVVPTIVGWFQTLWTRNAADRQRCLTLFQTECEEIARWNQDRIHDEVRVLLEKSGCDYMEELMTAVFVAHTKVLTAVRLSSKQKKLSITVPKLDHFIHRIFRESARCFWKTPFLFMPDGGVVERQKNLLQIEALASEAITTAVRGLLPVKQILHDYLGEDEEEIEEATEEKVEEKKEAEKEEEKKEAEKEAEKEEEKEAEEKTPVVEKKEVKVEKKEEKEEATEEKAEANADVREIKEEVPPSIVKIDTEPTVHFSDYDDVFDDSKAGPEIQYNPKEDDDESSDALTVDESSVKAINDNEDEIEDLDVGPKPVAKVLPKETIDDADVEVLE
jgi:hypothetical protein